MQLHQQAKNYNTIANTTTNTKKTLALKKQDNTSLSTINSAITICIYISNKEQTKTNTNFLYVEADPEFLIYAF